MRTLVAGFDARLALSLCLKGSLMTDQEIEKAVCNKVMLRLVPFLALLYTFNILDRGNVTIAALTMKPDLGFTDQVYGLGVGLFFIGYFLVEVPSNLIMERVGARRWIARIMISWGLVSACMMFVRNAPMFYAMRFLLGVAEAGFYPGIILYMTYWFPATVRARALARFIALTAILGLVGGPLGGLLLKMEGIGGLHGWQWLFLIEAMPSILFGFVVWKVLPDGPAQASWVTPEERDWIIERLHRESQGKHRVQHMSFKVAFSDPRILHLCALFFLVATAGNGIGSFVPQILKHRSTWTDSYIATILIIPALVGAIAMQFASAASDRRRERRLFVIIGYAVGGIGFVLAVLVQSPLWTIFALSINAMGERSGAGPYWALTTNLMGGRAAAGGIAFINSVGNLGGFVGPYMMGWIIQRNGGDYTVGMWVMCSFMFVASLLGVFLKRQAGVEPVAVVEAREPAPVNATG
jgi:ACS family tartrate transporter-like MFS transporter